MLDVLKLPFQFDAVRLKLDLGRIETFGWVPHFNTQEYEGDWSVLPLRSVDGKAGHIYPDPTAAADRFADTELLPRCPYFQEVLAAFPCPKRSVRLLRLAAGSRIREHRDYRLGFEDGELRIHVPVVTSPEVEFYVAGTRIAMREGEAWYVNFNLPHRLYNGGAVDRVHLVIDCEVNDWVQSLFYSENLAQFRQKVLDDPALQERLRGTADREKFVPLLVGVGEEHGYTFGPREVEAALSKARMEWLAGMVA